MVMTGTDAKTGKAVCLKVTGDRERHEAELRLRRKLDADYVVELFDHVEDKMGNLTMVLEYAAPSRARRKREGAQPPAHAPHRPPRSSLRQVRRPLPPWRD